MVKGHMPWRIGGSFRRKQPSGRACSATATVVRVDHASNCLHDVRVMSTMRNRYDRWCRSRSISMHAETLDIWMHGDYMLCQLIICSYACRRSAARTWLSLHPATLALAKAITARLPSSEEFLETAASISEGDAQASASTHPLAPRC
jgi:hypothetical protein